MRIKNKLNRKYMQISIYVIITAVVIYILSLIAKNAPTIIKELMERLSWIIRVVRPVILGFVFAYLLNPIVGFFEGRFNKLKIFKKMKKTRVWAAILSVLLLIIIIVGLISILIFSVTDQLKLANYNDIIRLAEGYINSLETFYNSLLQSLEKLDIQSTQLEQYVEETLTIILDILKDFLQGIVNAITNMSGYLTTILFGLITGFYFLIDGKMFSSYLKKTSYALLSEKANNRISVMLKDLDYAFSGYIRGQLADAFLMMILISLVLSITGVKFAIVIGIFAGLGNLIPYFGPVIAYISTTIVCLVNGEMQKLVVSMIALLIIQFVDGNIIGPKLLSRSIKIHPLIIIISLIFGSAIGGFLGMLLAVPVGAYIKLVFVRYVNNKAIKKDELARRRSSSKI
jgi:predicted PurR-regulated permease PerM